MFCAGEIYPRRQLSLCHSETPIPRGGKRPHEKLVRVGYNGVRRIQTSKDRYLLGVRQPVAETGSGQA